MPPLQIGDQAPPFGGFDQDGRPVRLADFAGRNLVLYFYPRDFTPGCTAEACSLRDGHAALRQAGYEVLGISPDPVERHRRFADRHGLPFRLLADPGKQVAMAYGAWGKKRFLGCGYMGIRRTTFLIDGNGIIRQIIRHVRPKDHASQVMQAA